MSLRENLKVSFVVPGYKCDDVIFRNLDSIFDQDYKNFEIVVVLNGQWETRDELAKAIREKYPEKLKVIVIDQPGLGNANNVGFRETTGDIVSHLSSDLYLMPGAVRNWVEAFEEHPDCGLVYSGYRFVSNNTGDVYFSEPFNLHHLKCENYIDGANPYRREFAPEWSTELKSLIDWDAMLQVAKKTKGYYIKEPLYYAEFPKPGGLSYDSANNWLSRWKAVRAKHGIPDCPVCITGTDYQESALEIAEITGFDFRSNPGTKPHDYQVIYTYGFNCGLDRIQYSCSIFMAHVGHKIIHWLPGDLRKLIQLRWVDVNYFVKGALSRIGHHWCLTSEDSAILSQVWLQPDTVYPPVAWETKNGDESYDRISVNEEGLLDELVKAMPDKTFVRNDPSCIIQVHFQDSPEKVLRSLCRGKIVVSDLFVPGVRHITGFTNVPELRQMIVHSIRAAIRNKWKPEQAHMDACRAKTNPNRFKEKLLKIAEKKVPKYGRLVDITEQKEQLQ